MSDNLFPSPPSDDDADSAYRVLARKYRPSQFADLCGQEILTRTLANAFAAGRLAHAFMLTGQRGVGKTTTARLIARRLNYAGKAGDDPLAMPELGAHCQAIMESRHMDVMEMDAASRTGIEDIRKLIESSSLSPALAENRIYIIDEVHMLSTAAFNGLLKTLEEPPPHVYFIFATTEIRKVPVTILSRCQRFDLRRLDVAMLSQLLARVVAAEKVSAQEEALKLIAQAAEGSARDALSLLDQAIAAGDGKVEGADVQSMLGLASRHAVLGLLDKLLQGEIVAALGQLRDYESGGGDSESLLRDLADGLHALTCRKAGLEEDGFFFGDAAQKAGEMASRAALGRLTLLWQILLNGLRDVKEAPHMREAAEMLLIRLAYAAHLPAPEAALVQLGQQEGDAKAKSSTMVEAVFSAFPEAKILSGKGG